jgi:hypothetical protein
VLHPNRIQAIAAGTYPSSSHGLQLIEIGVHSGALGMRQPSVGFSLDLADFS